MCGWGDEEQNHRLAWLQNPSPQGMPDVKQNGIYQNNTPTDAIFEAWNWFHLGEVDNSYLLE